MTDTKTTHYHAGWNMIGYLPEMDPSYPFESFADAKASMLDDLARVLDYSTDDPEHEAELEELSGEAEDLNLASGPEWGTQVGYMSYWINACSEEECKPHVGHFSRLGGTWWCDTCNSPYCDNA